MLSLLSGLQHERITVTLQLSNALEEGPHLLQHFGGDVFLTVILVYQVQEMDYLENGQAWWHDGPTPLAFSSSALMGYPAGGTLASWPRAGSSVHSPSPPLVVRGP